MTVTVVSRTRSTVQVSPLGLQFSHKTWSPLGTLLAVSVILVPSLKD